MLNSGTAAQKGCQGGVREDEPGFVEELAEDVLDRGRVGPAVFGVDRQCLFDDLFECMGTSASSADGGAKPRHGWRRASLALRIG